MANCLDVPNWRKSSRDELTAFLGSSKPSTERVRDLLAVRNHLRPVDVYSYLRARFGVPNGIQNILRRDTSDNLVHWDYHLKGGDEDVYICGTSRETHIIVSKILTDEQWMDLIKSIKGDFRNVRGAKSAIMKSFEKFAVFPNKYMALATLCSELHEQILNTPKGERLSDIQPSSDNEGSYQERSRAIAERGMKLWGDALKLRLLTPIMAEAYINMLILVFCRNEVRDDPERYEQAIRAKIPDRIGSLHAICDGFERAVDKSTETYASFMRTIAKRNFSLHGNVDPMREQLEIVYFEDKVPLFVNPGHHIERFFEHLERQNHPQDVITEYENVHLFLVELREHLTLRNRRFFEAVITDSYPGYELTKKRATRLFADHLVMGMPQGIRYDDQLEVDWKR